MAEESNTAARRVRSRRSHGGDRRVKVKGDTISGLPDVILQHILTFVPTKYAIRTSLLSKRWRHVWCDTPSLSFDSATLNDAWINQTPTGYTASKMMHFHLRSEKKDDVPHINMWLEFVMSRHVESMVLHFWRVEYIFPDFFYVNSSLKQLTLKYCDLSPKCSVSWTSLKNLSLERCTVPEESLAKILSGCPVLESLTLNRCYELSYLDLTRSPRLRTLVVEGSSWHTGPKDIEAPHIHYLYLIYSAQSPCTLVDVSSLTEANVNIFTNELLYSAGVLQPTVMNMLEKLQHVEKLTVGGNLLHVLSFAELHGVPFPMFKVKALTLRTRIFQYVIIGLKKVLQNSHDLKKLTVQTIHCDIQRAKRLDRYLELKASKTAQLCRRSKDAVHWDIKSKHLPLFVELVLKNTKTLDKMLLVLDHRYRMLRKTIQTLSRNNKEVSIVVSEQTNGES